MTHFFRKADIILFAGLIFLGVLGILFALTASGDVVNAVVTVNGEQFGTYPLDEDRILEIDTEFGHNTVEIRSGAVSVTDSDCSGHDCMRFGQVSAPGSVIICLPHRLVISVSGVDMPDVDAVVY